MTYRINLTGLTFHKWRVLGFAYAKENHHHYWRCICCCGKERDVEGYNLTSGRSRSCRRCSALVVAESCHATHRKSYSVVYRRWQAMKTRCYNSKQKNSYKYYGAMGVRVAPEWIENFERFYEYIGEPPTKYHTIDRIDPNGNYEPGNIRWATQSEQMKNTRRNHKKRQAQPEGES